MAVICWADSVPLVSPNVQLVVTNEIPRAIHVDVEEISANATIVVTWRDENYVWPQRGMLKIGPGKFDLWEGHTFYRPWSYYRACESCNETIIKRATAVRVDTDNVTTGWITIFQ